MLASVAFLSYVLRVALLAGGVAVLVIAMLDWAVRTRRLSPFAGVSRFMRTRVDSRLAGVERLVVRAGGHASATPWWAAFGYVVLALLVRALADVVIDSVYELSQVSDGGPRAVAALVIRWSIGVLTFALLVRVFGSWIPALSSSRWVRWSYGATEWMLRPLRQMLPSLGPIDISPLVAYFGLGVVRWLLERAVLGVP